MSQKFLLAYLKTLSHSIFFSSMVSFHSDIWTATSELNETVANTMPDNTSVVMICDGSIIETIQTNSPLVNVVNDTDKDSVTVLDLVMKVLSKRFISN